MSLSRNSINTLRLRNDFLLKRTAVSPTDGDSYKSTVPGACAFRRAEARAEAYAATRNGTRPEKPAGIMRTYGHIGAHTHAANVYVAAAYPDAPKSGV